MEINAITEDEIVVILSRDDVSLINNALNEVCNGIHLDYADLHMRMGFRRDEIQAILKTINHAARQMKELENRRRS